MVAERNSCVAFCAELNPNDMETVIRLFVKPARQRSQTSTLLSLTQNRFMMCPSPFPSRIEKDILRNSTGLQCCSIADVSKTFTEQRKVTVLQTESKSVLVKERELTTLAESKVKRSIISKKIVLRRLDSESVMKMLVKEEPERNPDCIPHRKNKNQMRSGCSSVKSEVPRTVHRQEPDESLQLTAVPYHNEKLNNPSYPVQRENSEEKYPVQASTDVEIDGPSSRLAINAPSFLSNHNTSVPSRYSFNSFPGYSRSSVYTANRQSHSLPAHVATDSSFLNSTPPRYRDFMTSGKRLSSFQKPHWQVNEKPDVSTLVDQGFFYTDRDDLVRCFQCGIGLKDWVKEDDVIKEHVKHSSSCTFLLHKVSRLQLERIKFEIASESVSSSSQSSAASGSQQPYKIKSPRYQNMEARLASFSSYPDIGIRPQVLAVAGLYYTGQGDLCRCFACDGGLKDWSAGDDPCKEHATYFPQCGYINQLKGSDYVRARQQERQNNAPEGFAEGYSQPTQDTYTPTLQSMGRLTMSNTSNDQSELTMIEVVQTMGYSELDVVTAKAELETKGDINPTADKIINAILDMKERSSNGAQVTQNTQEDDLQAIAEEHEELTKILQCMLCVREEPDILFLPCAHHRICHKCADSITRCPKCNKHVKEKIRTYRG